MERAFVGRAEVYDQLKGWLTKDQEDLVRVVSIEGSGGVGKTTLIEEVLRNVDLSSKGYLVLRLRGDDFRNGQAPKQHGVSTEIFRP